MKKAVKLKALEAGNGISRGLSWGVPWEKGSMENPENLKLATKDGSLIAVQNWPTAYWPDGSIKWTAHAAVLDNIKKDEFYFLSEDKEDEKTIDSGKISIKEDEDCIRVDTGKIVCTLNKKGSSFIKSIEKNNTEICSGSRMTCILEERSIDAEEKVYKEKAFLSQITKVIVEQRGPLRALIKLEGKHESVHGDRNWLPFVLRLYFFNNQESIRIVHSFIFDGNAEKDFIKGLGMEFFLPLKGEDYNRHIRFAGDTGVFAEAVRLLPPAFMNTDANLYSDQFEGKKIEIKDEDEKELVDDMASWGNFKLIQDSSDHYLIRKKTKEGCAWIDAAHGSRAQGLFYAGGEQGGLALALKDFWQKYPATLELNDLNTGLGKMKIWFYSPEVESMDLRHYDTVPHMESSYEGFNELGSTPYGIANTQEISLWCFNETPNKEHLLACAKEKQLHPVLICEPEYYYDTGVFAKWSLIDAKSTSSKTSALLEEQLDMILEFYKKEVEQRRWYGFWNYGDFMHSYDNYRHSWRYDVGGYAWQNTELVPNIWLWYSFLRTGRKDIFDMAAAMSRHTSEVDLYHIGEHKGLGSRHNVLHWGCACKEARIGMAGLHRFYYYLTADERIGDIMDEVKDADYSVGNLDPMRAIFEKGEHPTHARSGPDWAAFVSNWMTQWERYQDRNYKEKIFKGINSLKEMPYRLCSGPTFEYDPETSKLYHMGDENYSYHMLSAFGAPTVWMELNDLIDNDEWEEMLVELGEFYGLDEEEKVTKTAGELKGKGWGSHFYAIPMLAFAAKKLEDAKLAKMTWEVLLNYYSGKLLEISDQYIEVDSKESIKELKEIPWVSTNTMSLWSLYTIICLELIPEYLD
ncbi:exo-rhamnogalacturonan lyase family protein [Natronospora cellulosivora (SeqCode)]